MEVSYDIVILTAVILYILQENETANPEASETAANPEASMVEVSCYLDPHSCNIQENETANPEARETAANPKASMVEVSCYLDPHAQL